ncbi:MAG: hypothetical protein U0231_09085 [Nitrospiraceae bacterium]
MSRTTPGPGDPAAAPGLFLVGNELLGRGGDRLIGRHVNVRHFHVRSVGIVSLGGIGP